MFAIGANEYYTPSFLNTRRLGRLRFGHRQVYRAEHDLRLQRRRHVRLGRIRPPVARNLRLVLWLSPAYLLPTVSSTRSYNTWNVGVGFTYKVFTLDLRYSDTDLSKGDCNAFTSDFTRDRFGRPSTPINLGPGSKWCGATFIAKLSADVTAAGQPEVSLSFWGLRGAAEQSAALFLWVRPAWAHSCGWKSHRELVTASEVKRNCGRATDRGEEAWSEAAGR